MIHQLRNYLVYRKHGLRLAWRISGMNEIAWGVARCLSIVALAVALACALSRKAEAINVAADQRVAVDMAILQAENAELKTLLARCLGDREGVLIIGGRTHLCKAIPIEE